MSGNILVGETTREVAYCGHRIWAAYTSAAGKPVAAGGVVTVREEWVDPQGEKQHRLVEFRIDPENGDLAGIGKALVGLACGTPIKVRIGTIESLSGKTWRNLLGCERASAVKAA